MFPPTARRRGCQRCPIAHLRVVSGFVPNAQWEILWCRWPGWFMKQGRCRYTPHELSSVCGRVLKSQDPSTRCEKRFTSSPVLITQWEASIPLILLTSFFVHALCGLSEIIDHREFLVSYELKRATVTNHHNTKSFRGPVTLQLQQPSPAKTPHVFLPLSPQSTVSTKPSSHPDAERQASPSSLESCSLSGRLKVQSAHSYIFPLELIDL